MKLLIALVCGAIFGAGLVVSDMINPGRVTAFLDFAGEWDPATLFVFAGALVASGIVQALARRRGSPLFASRFRMPGDVRIDAPLVAGAVFFGVGWGLSGFCPGPAIAAISAPSESILLFVAAMVAGMALFRFLPRLSR